MSEEVWKPIDQFPYEVSSLGRVRRLGKPDPLKTSPSKSTGYCYVTLRSPSTGRRVVAVHILVCTAFHGPRPHGLYVAHGDGNRLRNDAANLRWATPKENARDTWMHGSMKIGENHHATKISDEVVRAIFLADGKNTDIAARFGVHRTYVAHVKSLRLRREAIQSIIGTSPGQLAPDKPWRTQPHSS